MKSNFDEINLVLKEHFDNVTPEEFRSNIEIACAYLLDDSAENKSKLVDTVEDQLNITNNEKFQEINLVLKEHFDNVTPEEFRSNIEIACAYLLDDSAENKSKLVDTVEDQLNITNNEKFQEINLVLKEHFDNVTPEEFRSNIEIACTYLLDDSAENKSKLVDTVEDQLNITNNEKFQEINLGKDIKANNSQPQDKFADPYSPLPLELSYPDTTAKVVMARTQKISLPSRSIDRKWFDIPYKYTFLATLLFLVIPTIAITFNAKNIMLNNGNGNGGNKTGSVAPTPLPVGAPPISVGESLIYPYVQVSDESGKKANINVIVLSSKYRWKIGEDKFLVSSVLDDNSGENTIEIGELNEKLQRDGVYELIKSEGGISRIISVGTASCEGPLLQEEARAEQRALATIKLVGMKMFEVSHYSFINLGRFKKADCNPLPKETSWQRSVVILGVRQEDDGVNITEAVRERLIKIPIELQDYSLGNKKFQVIDLDAK